MPERGYLLFLNDPWHPFTKTEALATLSERYEVLGCRIEEHNMSSAAFCWKNGTCAWSVVHAAERDVRNLKVTGNPPAELQLLLASANELQDKERKPFPWRMMSAEFDHFFPVPIDLAAASTGYQHDKVTQSWGKVTYELLQLGRPH